MKKDFWRDPLRACMMAAPQGRSAGMLCAALCAVFAAAAYAMLREMQGAAVIALCGALGLAALLWGLLQALRGDEGARARVDLRGGGLHARRGGAPGDAGHQARPLHEDARAAV